MKSLTLYQVLHIIRILRRTGRCRKWKEKEFLRQQLLNQQKASEVVIEKTNSSENNQEKASEENPETDYSKYLPKN